MSELFFGVQLGIRSKPGDPWRSQVVDLVRLHQKDLGLADQRGLFGALANLLTQGVDRATVGTWDLVPNGQGTWNEWTTGLEDDAQERWVSDHSGAALDHVLVTVAMLMPDGQPAADVLREVCDLEEAQFHERTTYRSLCEALARLPWTSVRRAGVYLTPGSEDLAFSLRELQGDGYDYLAEIT